MTTVKQVLEALCQAAPLHLAESWDNPGLQCGDSNQPVKGVLVALDCTMSVIQEAVEKGCDLIVTHHPLLFRGVKQVTNSSLEGQKLLQLLRHGIAVISMHTNLDIAQDGVNDCLARVLELEQLELLQETGKHNWQKIETYVPHQQAEQVVQAMTKAGAGTLGDYQGCTFQVEGNGTFLPMEGSHPYVGQVGKQERVQEVKIETVAPADLMPKVVHALLQAHPYEMPAYYITHTEAPVQPYGLGRIGNLPRAMDQQEFLLFVKEKLCAEGVRYCGHAESIRRVAVGGGACGEFAGLAFARGADAYVTADLKYHDFLDCQEKGYFVIDAGHFETENMVCQRLCQLVSETGEGLPVQLSQVHRDAVHFL